MTRLGPWLLVGLASACSTPATSPSAPESQPVFAVAPPVAAVEVEPEFPAMSEILYEQRLFSTYRSPALAQAIIPILTIYTDGTVLRAHPVTEPTWRLELGHARLSPTQLSELRDRLAALAPYEQVERAEGVCELEPQWVVGSPHFSTDYRIRVGEVDWICYAGCPIAPTEFASEFIELLRFLESFAGLEYQPWEPTHGHVVVIADQPGPTTLPWSTGEELPEIIPRAWLLDEASFASAWELVGRGAGPQHLEVGGRMYEISVVPWRPGEDASSQVARINGRDWELTGCAENEEWPRPRTP